MKQKHGWRESIRRLGSAMLLAAMLVPSSRADSSFQIESVRGAAGQAVLVPVTLRGETNVVAFQADIIFDPAVLLPGAITAGTVTSNFVFSSTDLVPGVRRLLVYSLRSTPMTNGFVARLGFTVPAGALQNALRLSLSNVLLVTAAPSAVLSTNRNGLIVLKPISIGTGGTAQFFLTASAGRTNIVQASTNLVQWIDLGSVVPLNTVLEFTDTNAPAFAQRFYRVVPQP